MSNGDIYPLTRGSDQLVRVHLLQQVWYDTNNYLIHPTASPKDARPLRIADVATASGLWLCELSRSIPDTELYELHGFDISSNSFIKEERLPKNVHLHVVDAKHPPPPEFLGQFDIVHIRLVQAVIVNDDPTWMIKHCLQLLRPGGYLQWEEFDPLAIEVHKKDSNDSALERLLDLLHARVPSTWVGNLPDHMTKLGLQVVETERKREPAYHHSIITYLHCLVWEEFANFIGGESGQNLRTIVQHAYEEGVQGAYAEYMFQTVVAKKAD